VLLAGDVARLTSFGAGGGTSLVLMGGGGGFGNLLYPQVTMLQAYGYLPSVQRICCYPGRAVDER
jgi:hypothetical protein